MTIYSTLAKPNPKVVELEEKSEEPVDQQTSLQ